MLFSGFAGLAYQIVWTQQLGVWLGHEFLAAAAVVAAFFGGLALGAATLGRLATRHPRPGLLYAQLELLIAVWALLLALLLPALGSLLTRLIGAEPAPAWHWIVAFVGPLILLLPATTAMGATLPAIQALVGRLREDGYAIGGVYAVNTFGAVLGVLAAALLLAPSLGLHATALLAVLTNLVCAGLAWRAFGGQTVSPAAPVLHVTRPRAPQMMLALSGLLGIGYEVLMVRVVSQHTENTVYTYALLLAVYLLGSAVGAAMFQRWLAGSSDAPGIRARLAAIAALALLGGALLMHLVTTSSFGAVAALKPFAASSFAAALGAEALLAMLVFLAPTLAMGALFSHLCVEAREQGWSLGESLAVNTVGAMVAAPLVAVVLLPALGASAVVGLLAVGYLVLTPRAQWRGRWPILALLATATWLLLRPGLAAIDVPSGGRVLSHRDGVMAAVTVVEDRGGQRTLHINNRVQEGSSATRVADARQAWLPLLLHPAPTRALFLGLGTGTTAAAAAADPSLAVTAVELLPEVVDAVDLFVPVDAPRPQIRVADARRYVRASEAQYDVVVADLFHPARSGSGALFTVEHFAAVRERLAPGGVFCQWLPLHQLDLASLRAIVAAYRLVYPDAIAVLLNHSLDTPVLGLVGHREVPVPQLRQIEARHAALRSSSAIAGLQFEDALSVIGTVVADRQDLAAFADGAVPNRDDLPRVAYHAPRLAYSSQDLPRDRLLAVVQDWAPSPARVFGAPDEASARADQERIAAYWQARDAFIAAGMAVRPTPDPAAMLAQIGGPLLGVLRLSPEFRPAYDPLLRIAEALAASDPRQARALLRALIQAQPQRPEAAALLAIHSVP